MEQLHPRAVWWFFIHFILRTIILFFIFLCVALAFLILVERLAVYMGTPQRWSLGMWVILFLFLYPAFGYFWATLTYRSWYYELTENVLRIEKGIIWKRHVSIPYEKIQKVDIRKGLIPRLLKLSNIRIQVTDHKQYGRAIKKEWLPGLDPKVAGELINLLTEKIKEPEQRL